MMHNRIGRWLYPACLCLLLALMSASASAANLQPSPAYSNPQQSIPSVELHEALVGEINKLTPLFANLNPVDQDISALIYEGLTRLNPYGEVVPALAQSWTVSDDGLDYIFRLRQDVLWQDGLPFSAADVAFTFRTIRHPDFPGDPALRDFWRTVEIQVLDDFSIRFRLVQPLASFPERLRQGIVPLHALEGAPIASLDDHPFSLAPIGTGAYQIEQLLSDGTRITGLSLRLAPNFRQRPEAAEGYAIDRIIFRTYPSFDDAIQAYLNGEVNSVGAVPDGRIDDLRPISTLATHTTTAPAVGVLIFNWREPELAYFRDQRLRQGLTYALNRPGIVVKALGSRALPADSTIPPSSWAFSPEAQYPSQNLDVARQLINSVSFEPRIPDFLLSAEADDQSSEEAAAEETPEPEPVPQRREFRIMVLDDSGIAGVAFEVASTWGQVGFTVALDIVAPEDFISRLDVGDFDAALVEYQFSPQADPDQFAFWHINQYPDGQNYGGMADSFISNVLAQARVDPNGLHRKVYYAEFQNAFASRSPAIVLYHPLFVYATDKRLGGVQLDFISAPSDRFRTIQDWHFVNPE